MVNSSSIRRLRLSSSTSLPWSLNETIVRRRLGGVGHGASASDGMMNPALWVPNVFAGSHGEKVYRQLEKVAAAAQPGEEGFACLDRRFGALCQKLKGGPGAFADVEAKFGLDKRHEKLKGRKTLFASFECGQHKTWSWCDRHGSLGNQFGLYVYARAVAQEGNMDFVRSGVPCPPDSHGLLAFMPRVATAESSKAVAGSGNGNGNGNSNGNGNGSASSAAAAEAAAAVAPTPGDWRKAQVKACTGRQQYVHTNKNWASFTPRLRIELRAALVRGWFTH